MNSNDQPPPTECQKSNIKEATTVLLYLVKALVDFPEQVRIRAITGLQTVVFEITVAPIDIKRLIGRKGRTANAARELLLNIGAKVRYRYLLEITEPTFRVQEISTIGSTIKPEDTPES